MNEYFFINHKLFHVFFLFELKLIFARLAKNTKLAVCDVTKGTERSLLPPGSRQLPDSEAASPVCKKVRRRSSFSS